MKKTVARTSIALGGVLAAALLYWEWLNIPPTADIPTPVMPSPNGFDALSVASKLQVKSDEVSAAILRARPKPARYYSLADKMALVEVNRPALSSAREALRLAYSNPRDSTGKGYHPEFSQFRNLAQLFCLDSQVKFAHGDYTGALDANIDAVELGVKMPRGGPLIAEIIGVGCESIGDRPIWRHFDKLDASAASVESARLEAVLSQRFPFADTLREEKWSGQASYAVEFRDKSTFAAFDEEIAPLDSMGGDSDEDSNADIPGFGASSTDTHIPASMMIGVYGSLLVHSKRRIVADYTTMMDAYIAQAQQPFVASVQDVNVPNDPFNEMVGPLYKPARFRDVQMRTEGGLLLCALALRAYRVQQGDYPVSLGDLVTTGFLKAAPDDPFAATAGTSFRYRRVSADTFVLYSVGPDGIDNGGKPIAPPASQFASLQATDKGDWVAGVNVGNLAPPAVK